MEQFIKIGDNIINCRCISSITKSDEELTIEIYYADDQAITINYDTDRELSEDFVKLINQLESFGSLCRCY